MSVTSLITQKRREYLRDITGGARTSIPRISKIAFADGGVETSGINAGKPISPSSDMLTAEGKLKNVLGSYPAVLDTTYNVTTTARYTATIPAVDHAGALISVAALTDDNDVVHAIKTMYVKQKDEGVIFTFTFDDEF